MFRFNKTKWVSDTGVYLCFVTINVENRTENNLKTR